MKARDIWGAGSAVSDPLIVTITDNTPPNTPTITGPIQIRPFIAYTYTISGTDNQSQDLTYYIDWGDGNAATGIGPYHSGATFTLTHTWKMRGTFSIKIRATDTVGAYSEWATVEVITPVDFQVSFNLWFQYQFERYPHMFPILRHIYGF